MLNEIVGTISLVVFHKMVWFKGNCGFISVLFIYYYFLCLFLQDSNAYFTSVLAIGHGLGKPKGMIMVIFLPS